MNTFFTDCFEVIASTTGYTGYGQKGKQPATEEAVDPLRRDYEKVAAESGELWWGDSDVDAASEGTVGSEAGEVYDPMFETRSSSHEAFRDAAPSLLMPPASMLPPPRAQARRRRSSISRVAYRWGLSLTDAQEIVNNFERVQSPDDSGSPARAPSSDTTVM